MLEHTPLERLQRLREVRANRVVYFVVEIDEQSRDCGGVRVRTLEASNVARNLNNSVEIQWIIRHCNLTRADVHNIERSSRVPACVFLQVPLPQRRQLSPPSGSRRRLWHSIDCSDRTNSRWTVPTRRKRPVCSQWRFPPGSLEKNQNERWRVSERFFLAASCSFPSER